MTKTRVKAGGITSLTDARYFSAWGADWLGFPVGRQPDKLSPEALSSITEWVEGPQILAEFGLEEVETILEITRLTHVNGIQVSPFFPIGDLPALSAYTIFQEFVPEPNQTQESMELFFSERDELVDFYVLELSKNRINWSDIQRQIFTSVDFLAACFRKRAIFLDIPVLPKDVTDILDTLQPWGLSVHGGAEEKTGVKSFEDLDEIMEMLSDRDTGG